MKHLKRVLYTFADYLIFALVTFTMLTSIFPFALNGGAAKIICTAITAFMTWGSLYSYYWNNAGKDWRYIKSESKRNPEFKGKFKPYYGFVASLPFVICNIILSVLAFTKDGIFAIVYKIVNISCMGFIMSEESVLYVAGVAVAALMPSVVCTAGYIVGKTGFSITEKYLPWLIYKKPKDKNKIAKSAR